MKKKKLIPIGLAAIVVILLLGFGIYFLFGKSVATPDSTILSDQVVDGLSFENAKFVYENGITTFTVEVTNTNTTAYSLKYVKVNITSDSSDNTLIGYIGESLPVNQRRLITASIDKNITNATNLEYVIEK